MCASTWRSRLVWSRAHDWKSCNRQKRFEGSNPSSSATAGSNPSSSATAEKCEPRKGVRIFFVAAEEVFRMRTTPLNALLQGDFLRTNDENGQHVRRGSAACEEQDAFALMPHKVSSLSPRGKLFRIDLALRYFAGTPIFANIPPPLHESEGYYNKKGADNTSARVVCSARELNRRCWGA